jgi:hypothetical protein
MEMPSWYILVTSASGRSVYSTLGPYLTRELADTNARESHESSYRVRESGSRPAHTLSGSRV